jgi:cysteinyl-tRNA synthetase
MLKFYNTLSKKIEYFHPYDPNHIKMYVCGPTLYDSIHIGNARTMIFYDVVFRTLMEIYPKVTYVRNITDIDDKIINKAIDLNISEDEVSTLNIKQFQEDLIFLNCLNPSYQPKVSESIEDIIYIIEKIFKNEYCYKNQNGDILFDTMKYKEYGSLSNRKFEDNQINRIISLDKKNSRDFILWKKTNVGRKWNSPWGDGRPGWHIECSAMSYKHLGENFDIHGGGVDLIFPHHENEIAQSKCAFENCHYAKYWLHNGFLMINGEKMSKSLGNFITIQDLIERNINPNVIRILILLTQYQKPINFTEKLLYDSEKIFEKI